MTQNASLETLLIQGNEQLDQEHYQAALETFLQADVQYTQNLQVKYKLGLTCYRIERYQEAVGYCNEALKIKPNYILALARRGLAYQELNQPEQAREDFEQAIQFEPQDYEDWRGKGIVLYELKRYEDAIASYDKAIELKPDNHQAWFNRGNALDSLGRYQDAIASYDKAIELKPDKHEAWNNRGNALDNLGRYEDALASFDKAIEFKPDYYEAWVNRGVALDNLGRYEDAIASYDKAIGLKPDYYEAWFNRGVALDNLGRYEDAIASYFNALEIKPDLHEAWYNWHLSVRQQQNPFPYWLKAQRICLKALDELTFEQSPLRHLEVLQYLLKICDYLGDSKTIEERLEKGRQQLDELQRKCQFEGEKISLERKFAAFEQLRIDRLANSPNPDKQIQALELAEKRKNTCLGWLRGGWGYNERSPKYREMQQLLNSNTAIIYWHVSPVGITTWILKHNQPPQILQPPPPPKIRRQRNSLNFWQQQPQQYPAAAYQLHQFEEWLKAWKSDYQTYRNSGESATAKAQLPWRTLMRSRLTKLGEILDIPQIQDRLRDVTQLILIPHRDLHLLPLHCLFSPRFTITYLPSAKIGLSLPKPQPVTSILNVENPRRDLPFAIIQAKTISSLYPHCEQLEVPAITKDKLIEKLRTNSDNFHFTGHGYHDIDEPQKSALLLAEPDKFTLEDILSDSNNLDFNQYKLICLSACESGITSKQKLVDEYVGLTTGFLDKGASCVVSSLWNVNEQSTALLMIQFYQLLKTGETPAAALKSAQVWLRTLTYRALADWYLALANQLAKNQQNCSAYLRTLANIIQRDNAKMIASKPPFEDPYYWAAFIITGKPPEE